MDKPSNVVLKINLDILGPELKKIIFDSMEEFNMHFNALLPKKYDNSEIKNKFLGINIDKQHSTKAYELLQILVFSSLDPKEVCEIVFSNYLRIISNIDSEDEKYFVLSSVVIELGENIIRCYYSNLYVKYIEQVKTLGKTVLPFSEWFEQLDDFNKRFNKDSTLYAKLGGALIGILEIMDILRTEVESQSRNIKRINHVVIIPDRIKKHIKNNIVYTSPTKLPMIVKPKLHTSSKKGGYLLNDDLYTENLIIDKSRYRDFSKIMDNNVIYDMVNNLSSTPFKINEKVL